MSVSESKQLKQLETYNKRRDVDLAVGRLVRCIMACIIVIGPKCPGRPGWLYGLQCLNCDLSRS